MTTASAHPVESSTSKESVADVMREMYASLSVDDAEHLKTVFTSDFYAFDGGKRFDGPGLVKLVVDAHKAGKTFVWTVREPDVRLSGDVAFIAYTNIGSVGDAAAVTPVTWHESAMLRFEEGRWKIAFFHSSRAVAP
jgi:ketosteroid isomerase-like protein